MRWPFFAMGVPCSKNGLMTLLAVTRGTGFARGGKEKAMNEKCDQCGETFPVGGIIFTGRQYLCQHCFEDKLPTHMGASQLAAAQLCSR